MKLNIEEFKLKSQNIKKRYLFIIGVLLVAGVFAKVFLFKPEDNFGKLIDQMRIINFSKEELEKEEEAKVLNQIENEEARNKGIGRDIFFSNSSIEEIAPDLIGVMIGRKKSAMFSDGKIYIVGDEFYGNRVSKISRTKVTIVNELGEQKILEVRGN